MTHLFKMEIDVTSRCNVNNEAGFDCVVLKWVAYLFEGKIMAPSSNSLYAGMTALNGGYKNRNSASDKY